MNKVLLRQMQRKAVAKEEERAAKLAEEKRFIAHMKKVRAARALMLDRACAIRVSVVRCVHLAKCAASRLLLRGRACSGCRLKRMSGKDCSPNNSSETTH